MVDLSGKICLVTGASRSIGKGIALYLTSCGATCFITGRHKETLQKVVEESKQRQLPGKIIAVVCDHACDSEVKELFERIKVQSCGQLDLLVNNAYAAAEYIVQTRKVPFWALDPFENWDNVNNVGLRNHFVCATLATRLMLPRKSGIIVNIGSVGGLMYTVNTAYGIGKAAIDRMTKDSALELQGTGITFLSLWPSAVQTDLLKKMNQQQKEENHPDYEKINYILSNGEHPEFVGNCIAHLMKDPKVSQYAGKVVLTDDIAVKHNLTNIDGSRPLSIRSFRAAAAGVDQVWLAKYIPSWFKIPRFLFMWLLSITTVPQEKDRTEYEDAI